MTNENNENKELEQNEQTHQDNQEIENSNDSESTDNNKAEEIAEPKQESQNEENTSVKEPEGSADEVKTEFSVPPPPEFLDPKEELKRREEEKKAAQEEKKKQEEEEKAKKEAEKEEEKKKEAYVPDPNFEAPVNEEAQKKQNAEFEKLLNEVTELHGKKEDITDYRNTRKLIVTLRERVSALFLISAEQKDSLISKIQEIFEHIAEKQEKERENINQVYDENLEKIKPTIEEGIKKALENELFKDARKELIELQKKVREVKLRPSDRDNIFAKIQEGFDEVNAREEKYRESFEMESSENYIQIKPKVEKAAENAKTTEKFNDARKELIELQKELKEVKLTRTNRDELFGIVREAFNELNAKQDKERAEFLEKAEEEYPKAAQIVDEAIKFSVDPDNITKARPKLIEAQNKLKDFTLTRQQRDELFGKIREIFNQLNENNEENTEEFQKEASLNFAKLEIKVNEAVANVEYSEDFRDIREGLIMVQDEIKIVKLKRNQRNELLSRVRKGFEKFDKKRKDYNDRRKEEKTRKLKNIVETLEEKNKRFQENIETDKASLSEQEAKLESATDEEKAEIEKSIKSLNDKITSREKNLEQNNARIEDINKELAKLNK